MSRACGHGSSLRGNCIRTLLVEAEVEGGERWGAGGGRRESEGVDQREQWKDRLASQCGWGNELSQTN